MNKKEFSHFSTSLSSAIKRNQNCLDSLNSEKHLLIDIIENLLNARDTNKKIFTTKFSLKKIPLATLNMCLCD